MCEELSLSHNLTVNRVICLATSRRTGTVSLVLLDIIATDYRLPVSVFEHYVMLLILSLRTVE